MKRLRQSTVEPVFGSLMEHYGMRKVGVRGKAGAHKVMLMAAIAFNLKKYLKFKPLEVISEAIVLKMEQKYPFSGNFMALTASLFQLGISVLELKASILSYDGEVARLQQSCATATTVS